MKISQSCLIGFTLLLALPVVAQPASIGAQNHLGQLREEIRRKGYTFTVGDNPALEIPLELLCGTFPGVPEGFTPPPEDRPAAKLDLPERFDWRDLEACPPVRNQGACGSCWAFAAVGVVESQALLKDGQVVDLAEQMSVDCDRAFGNHGCAGGYLDMAMIYLKNIGATMEAWYPYKQKDFPFGACIGEPVGKPYKIRKFGSVTNQVESIKQAIYEHGPVGCSVAVDDLFQAYTSGIYDGPGAAQTNHAVILVGWDDNGGEGYWIMRNSWGPDWGEAGYMRIRYGAALIGSNCRWAELDPAAGPKLSQLVVTPDAEGDGVLDPGETAAIRVRLQNSGTPASQVTATVTSSHPQVSLVKTAVPYPDLAPGANATGAADFVIQLGEDLPKASLLEFQLQLNAAGYSAAGRFWIRVRKPEVLILDFDPNHNSAPAIRQALAANGVEAVDHQSYDLSDLGGYLGIFACLGVYPDVATLAYIDHINLRRTLARGNSLYLEGGDFWTNPSSEAVVRPWFYAKGEAGGSGDLATVIGTPGSLWASQGLDYAGDNKSIDHLAAEHGAELIFENTSPAYGCGVANDRYDYYGWMYYFRSIGVSFEFGGLQDGWGQNNRAEVMRRMLQFLDIPRQPIPGDVNGNRCLEAGDVLLLAYYLAEDRELADGGEADVDANQAVNVLDLLALAGLVVDGR